MNTIVGVYEAHDDAVNAVKALEKAGYATKMFHSSAKLSW